MNARCVLLFHPSGREYEIKQDSTSNLEEQSASPVAHDLTRCWEVFEENLAMVHNRYVDVGREILVISLSMLPNGRVAEIVCES